jgi:uncharacterized protein YbbK (DUF523 family)
MGDAVRYDGQHKAFPTISQFFQAHATLHKLCPEMLAGLGTPRPAVELHSINNSTQALGVDNLALNVTQALTDVSQQFSHTEGKYLQGLIVKSRSPSCGFGSTAIKNETSVNKGNGIFTQTISNNCTHVLIIENDDLTKKEHCEMFLFHCYILLDIKKTTPENRHALEQYYAKQYQWNLSLETLRTIKIPSGK